MADQKSLKEQNLWLINIAVLLHIIVFFWITVQPIALFDLKQDELLKRLQSLLAPGAVSLGVICILRLVLLGMIPSGLRDNFVHWRTKHTLPGSRAFTKIGVDDPRVNLDLLAKIHSSLPTDPAEQGQLFYQIYKKRQSETGVLDAHKSYLAMRDISILNLMSLLTLSPMAYYMIGSAQDVIGYVLTLVLVFFLTSFAAQNYARRMVENVLAAECE